MENKITLDEKERKQLWDYLNVIIEQSRKWTFQASQLGAILQNPTPVSSEDISNLMSEAKHLSKSIDFVDSLCEWAALVKKLHDVQSSLARVLNGKSQERNMNNKEEATQ